MKGVNIAEYTTGQRLIYENSQSKGYCVFLSHKKEDKKAAIAIGQYLTDVVGVNIYLDINDAELQEATREANDKKIVESIKKGLNASTHLLCLISESTKLSWWVPYEIGLADAKEKDIASMKLKGIEDVPSYLKIHKTLYNVEEFLRYASKLEPLAAYFESSNFQKLSNSDISQLKLYVD